MKLTQKSVIAIALMLLSSTFVGLYGAKAQAVVWTVSPTGPADFHKIGLAINAATHGDIIYVKAGNYLESLTVNKSVTLIGENPLSTFISGIPVNGALNIAAINVTANNVNIINFSISSSIPHINAPAVLINFCSNVVVANNTITNSQIGIALYGSNNNCIANNTLRANGYALSMDSTANNNVFYQNNITQNTVGLYLYFSYQNTFYHNTITQNSRAVFLIGTLQNNWDSGYPSGGNHWDNFIGGDSNMGQYQNITGKDGISDSLYQIGTNNIDQYPLMHPYSHVAGDLNKDGAVDFADIVYFVKGYVSYYEIFSVSSEFRVCDLNNDGQINPFDLVLFAHSYVNYQQSILP